MQWRDLQDGVDNCIVWMPCHCVSSIGIQGACCQAGSKTTPRAHADVSVMTRCRY